MYTNKPSVTKIEAADRVYFCIVLSAGLNSTNLENLVNCLYPCPDMPHFMIITERGLLLPNIEFKH